MNSLRLALLLFSLALLTTTTTIQGFVIQAPTTTTRLVSVVALVPEQAKELEAYYECECELQAQRRKAAGGTGGHHHAPIRGAPLVAWCRRVWNGVGRHDRDRFRRQTSSTAAHKNHAPTMRAP